MFCVSQWTSKGDLQAVAVATPGNLWETGPTAARLSYRQRSVPEGHPRGDLMGAQV